MSDRIVFAVIFCAALGAGLIAGALGLFDPLKGVAVLRKSIH